MQARMEQTEEAILLLTNNLTRLTDVFYGRVDSETNEVTIKSQNKRAIEAIKASFKPETKN